MPGQAAAAAAAAAPYPGRQTGVTAATAPRWRHRSAPYCVTTAPAFRDVISTRRLSTTAVCPSPSMCQAGEDYAGPAQREPPPVPRPSREQKCVKCAEGLPVVVIRAGDAFCRDCFKAFYVHKFRAMLGKNRVIFPGEKVLLSWSGGPSSSSMVWQVLEGLSQDSAKRLRFVPGVIYVDEGAACGQSLEDRVKTLAEVKRILGNTGFPFHVVALEEVFSLPPSVLRRASQEPAGTEEAYKAAVDSFLQQQHVLGTEACASPAQGQGQLRPSHSQEPSGTVGHPKDAQTEALSRLFKSIKTLTAKEELLQTLRTHLTVHVARSHGYRKVMTGESCTRLAIKLMTNLALGRGAFLAWDTAPEKASIHRLMEAFILKLQTLFPSTVSTVYRTSEKLVKAPREGCATGPSGPNCLLCMCALDVDNADSATAFGAQSSSHLSQMLTAEAGTPTRPCCGAGEGQTQSCHRAVGRREDAWACIIEQLCYSCRVNMKDLPSLDPLPPYVLTEAQLRSQRGSVSEEIQEYLIEEEEEEDRAEPCEAMKQEAEDKGIGL
uniref:Cytoplasmic tRNA 2-thiolation protein 2 n=1 Tax=Rattus norvegicus TaxID=10116 RepID=A0ABK0LC11_RAT